VTLAAGDVLLTGTTGFVGMELLARYLERSDRRVSALVRAPTADAARARMDAVLENLFGSRGAAYRDRVDAVAADVTAEDLGLDARTRDALAERTTTIVHSAASVSFTLALLESRAVNLAGTRRMLELAELAQRRGGLDCYGHVSTAYVAGDHAGRFAESDLDVGQGFHNPYERSKFEAEQLVRSHEGLPTRIMRPSIIVGDRHSGWTAAFNVLYWPLRALSRGLFAAIPAYPTALLDVVSVDYVADAVYALCETAARPRPGETYHLTASADASTLAEVAGMASRYFRRPAPRVVSPAEFAALPPDSVAQESVLSTGRAYFPYFAIDTVFDNAATRARLEPTGIRVSPLSEYLERLLDFATRSSWGKLQIPRAQALAG
jgi:thioester reductase-like protein